MRYNLSDILRDIRIILDRNGMSEELIAVDDNETLRLNELIEHKLFDAIRFVLSNAPSHMVGRGKPFADVDVFWDKLEGVGSGFFLLPTDFLRLVTFQMSDWTTQVSNPITEDSPLYIRQKSKFIGIKGNPQKPVAALVNHPSGLCLEFYSCVGGADVYVKSFRYIGMPEIIEGECERQIELPHLCYDAIKYYAAYLAASALELPTSQTLAEQFKLYMQ